jgi:hypothetical protein
MELIDITAGHGYITAPHPVSTPAFWVAPELGTSFYRIGIISEVRDNMSKWRSVNSFAASLGEMEGYP